MNRPRVTANRVLVLMVGSLVIAVVSIASEPEPIRFDAARADRRQDVATHPTPRTTSVRSYGARGNGKADDTKAIQAALDAAASGDRVVYFPPGVYLARSLQVDVGLVIRGAGTNSCIKALGIGPARSGHLFLARAREGEQIEGLEFHSLAFIGSLQQVGFDVNRQWDHLLNLTGVRRLRISDCYFGGMKGDAIYLGADGEGGGVVHNNDVVIERCQFNNRNYAPANGVDGMRNGISVIDGTQVRIRHNRFDSITKQKDPVQDQPGPIDLEPNEPDSQIRDIEILSNHFVDCGGKGGLIAITGGGQALLTPLRDVRVRNNRFERCGAFGFSVWDYGATNGTSANVLIEGNVWVHPRPSGNDDARPFKLVYGNDVTVTSNTWVGFEAAAIVGDYRGPGHGVRNVKFVGNTFKQCVDSGKPPCLIRVYDAANLGFYGNTFEGCEGPIVQVRAVADGSLQVKGLTMSGNVVRGAEASVWFDVLEPTRSPGTGR